MDNQVREDFTQNLKVLLICSARLFREKISKVKMTFIVHIVALSEEENKVEINEFLLFLHLLFFKSTRFDLKKKQLVFLSLE